MNAIVLSPVWGVIMMFSGLFFKRSETIRIIAIVGVILLVISTIVEMGGTTYFNFNTANMLVLDSFSLLFNVIAFSGLLLLFLLSGKDIEKVGLDVSDYYALLFFVMAGVAISSGFNNLLMLFLGIEIISIPLYILTG